MQDLKSASCKRAVEQGKRNTAEMEKEVTMQELCVRIKPNMVL